MNAYPPSTTKHSVAWFPLSCLVVSLVATSAALAGPASSARYNIPASSIDAGGRITTSVAYRNDASVGGVSGLGTVASPTESAKHGYVGQLYEIQSIVVSASSTNVDEGATRQLRAAALLDDGTSVDLVPANATWSVSSGPIQSVNAAGLAQAGHVYQDTPAVAQVTTAAKTGSLMLLVRNVSNDDYGLYAGDGLDDAWQVQYFGENNPNGAAGADPDNDGQNNAYEELVGSNPVDGNSYFRFRIESVPGHSDQMNLVFSPRVGGRTYTVQSKPDLAIGSFGPLGTNTIADVGLERTVTDRDASGTNKFYRVQITRP